MTAAEMNHDVSKSRQRKERGALPRREHLLVQFAARFTFKGGGSSACNLDTAT
jgi:hypothetical protein